MTALPANFVKTNLDQGTDDPKAARLDLVGNVDKSNAILSYLSGLLGGGGTSAEAKGLLGYLTTKADVETVLTGLISSHAHPDVPAIDNIARQNIANLFMSNAVLTANTTTELVNGVSVDASDLTVTSGGYVTGLGTVESDPPVDSGVDAVPTMAGYTNGAVTISTNSEFSGSYLAWHAFDDVAGPWIGANPFVAGEYLTVDFGSATYIPRWRMQGYGDPSFCPRDFSLQGSDNGVDWTTIQSLTGITWVSGEWKEWTIGKTYRYFRLRTTAVNGAAYSTVVEMELIGANKTPGDILVETASFTALAAPTSAQILVSAKGATSVDMIFNLSTDGGTTYTTGSNITEISSVGGIDLWSADIDLTGNAGTNIKAKFETVNFADVDLHALSVLWS